MAESILEHLRVDALRYEHGGMAMAEIMETDRFSYRSLHGRDPEPAAEVRTAYRSALW